MPYKEYPPNPIYQNVPDDYWTSGLCALFACALHERFGLSMQSIIVKADDGEETMIHTYCVLPDGRTVDANGISRREEYLKGMTPEDLAATVHRPVKETRIEFEDVDLERLGELTPEDVEDTNAAHDYIDRHPDLFAELSAKSAAEQAIFLNEKDVADVAKWLRCDISRVAITPGWLPIEEKQDAIDSMMATYADFPKERARTAKILKLIQAGAPLQPVFIGSNDEDKFVMEGRHRLVAFFQAGLSHIPVALVSRSPEPIPDFAQQLRTLTWPTMPSPELPSSSKPQASPQI